MLRRVGWILIAVALTLGGAWGYESWGTVFLANRMSADALEQTRQALAAGAPGVAVVDSSDSTPDDDYLDPSFSSADLPDDLVMAPDALPDDVTLPPPYLRADVVEEGSAFGVLTIPDLDLEIALIEGVSAAELKVGVGHMPRTPLPGELGNSVVSGHRTTWAQPFNRIDTLTPGSLIFVETVTGTHTYEVTEQFIVKANEIWVTGPIEGAWLTLTSCHPKGSARERIITRARLVDSPNLAYVNHMWGTDWPHFETSFPRF